MLWQENSVAQEQDAMSWEPRPGGIYYYKSVRRGAKVKKLYFGKGPSAELASRLADEARARRGAEVAALRAERARLDPPDAAMVALELACALATEVELAASGYRRGGRGWRRAHA